MDTFEGLSESELMLITLEERFFWFNGSTGFTGLTSLTGFFDGTSESELMLITLEDDKIFCFFLTRVAEAKVTLLAGLASTSESELMMRTGEPESVAVNVLEICPV
jgi:hypothetical protein